MKKHLFTAIIMLICIKYSSAQWTILPSGSFAELRSAFFLNSQTGFIVGSDSVIMKTTNAGVSWTSIISSTTDTLRCIYFTDDTTGYAVGANGTIIKTVDAGNTWQSQVSGSASLLRSVHFPTHDTGYVVGGNGTILKTTDGGASWLPQASGTTQDLISTRFGSADTGYAVSSLPTFFGGLILKTVDGGANWDTVFTHVQGFLSVFTVSNDTVYAAGGAGTIVKTTDGGANWITQPTGDTNRLRASFFITADTGYVAGELGKTFFTSDGGASWVDQTTQATGLLGLYFPMSDTGYVVGTAGIVLRYSKPCNLAAQPSQIFGGTTVCDGSSFNYHISPVANANSYTWTGPSGSVVTSGQGDTLVTITFGSSSGNISVTADNQCGASIPIMLTVIVNPLPPVPLISENGQSLVTSAADAWQWYLNGSIIAGADTSQYFPTQNGSYSVMVTNSFGCTATSTAYTVINAGINEPGGRDLVISPIPFHDEFTISWNHAPKGKMYLEIFSIDGHKLQEIALNGGSETIVNAAGMSAGIYFYVVKTDNKIVFRGKLLKE